MEADFQGNASKSGENTSRVVSPTETTKVDSTRCHDVRPFRPFGVGQRAVNIADVEDDARGTRIGVLRLCGLALHTFEMGQLKAHVSR